MDDCPCGHASTRIPQSRAEAIAMYGQQRTEALLDLVARSDEKWMRVLQCRVCRRYWAEECITSGHADLYWFYPIETSDPVEWLDAAVPLDY